MEPFDGRPRTLLYIEPFGRRLGIRFHARPIQLPITTLSEISISLNKSGKSAIVDVSTDKPELFREFYTLCCDIADRVQVNGESVDQAIMKALGSWAALIKRRRILSSEEQLGLMGELYFLRHIARHLGWWKAALSWQGPGREEHDFVLPFVDVDVKATAKEIRKHTISSVTQLVPKDGRPLYVVSLLLTPGGVGHGAFKLGTLISEVLASAEKESSGAVDIINAQLGAQGWSEGDSGHYATSFLIRGGLVAIRVDGSFPAITPQVLSSCLPATSDRIEGMTYVVNLEGLGICERDGASFRRVLFGKPKQP